MKIRLSEIRTIIRDVLEEMDSGTPSAKSLDDKAKADKRKVVDTTRDAISTAVSSGVKDRIVQLVTPDVFKYSDVEIIDEPPKTLIRFTDVDGEKDKDTIYMINVTKLI